MNWKNVNLKSSFECSQDILDGYDFETLLLEISCNLPVINEETVKAQAMHSIKCKYETAIQILNDNLNNIVNHAINERNK